MFCLLQAGIGSEEETVHDSTPDAVEDATRFGVYEIDCHADGSFCELGRGAMGVTYRATDTSLQRKVALKIIKTNIAERSADSRERFVREARAAAALRHEHIAAVYQFGMRLETGQYFYAMELIEGETLDERVHRAGPLDARTTIGIAEQVTSALAAAEKHGLVHRDLKPANLMLVNADDPEVMGSDQARSKRNRLRALRKSRIPVVKIIDFGLAKAFHSATDPKSLTHGRFVGTPAFASPEQFEHSALDVRSDIYSLGETLWFALTGKTPFAGRTLSEIHSAQKSNALPADQLKSAHVPHHLKSLIGSMLAFEPASRPGTGELAARLQRCSPEVRKARRTHVALAAAAILILAVLLVPPSKIPKPPSDKSIAVLPFENLSEDKANAYFADGIQDEILTRLSNIADLKVISRTSTRQCQSKPANLREIAKQLGVANILEGSVQKVADQVRVNVQLINAQADSHLWADTYDRKLTDIFGVESDIAKRIADSLQAKLTGREEQALAVKPTNNPEAYDAYLRGLAFEARTINQSDLRREAIGFYERAVQLDPNFAVAWARLSRAQAFLYAWREDTTPPTRRDAAKSALETAQKLEPNSPETLLALGYYQYCVLHDDGLAKTTFKEASKLLPGSSEIAAALGLITQEWGHEDESIAYFEQGLALDPRNMNLLVGAAETYAMLRQFPAAIELYDRALDVIPNDPELIGSKATMYQAEGNLPEAAKLLINVSESSGNALAKLNQLRLERNHTEAIRLLQADLVQLSFGSELGKVPNLLHLAFAQRFVGDTAGAKVTAEQARNALEPLCKKSPVNGADPELLSLANALLGERDSAPREEEPANPISNTSGTDQLAGEELGALIQTTRGENSRAISILAQLLKAPYVSTIYGAAPVTPALLRLDPLWDPLRADPAFQKLCEQKQP